MDSLTFLFALHLCLATAGVSALTCWNCTTEDGSSDCATGHAPTLLAEVGDILGYTRSTGDQYRKMECNESLGTLVCGKTITKTVDGVSYVARGCNYGYNTGCNKDEVLGRVATVCFCDKDLCNSALNQQPIATLAGAVCALAIMML